MIKRICLVTGFECITCDVNQPCRLIFNDHPPRYQDDSFPERACDYCGKLYRGPAVYCSLNCAVGDA